MIDSRAIRRHGHSTGPSRSGSYRQYIDENLDIRRLVRAIEHQESRVARRQVPSRAAYMALSNLLTMLGVAVVIRLPNVKWSKVPGATDISTDGTWMPEPAWALLGSHFIVVPESFLGGAPIIVHVKQIMLPGPWTDGIPTAWEHVETLRATPAMWLGKQRLEVGLGR